MVSFSGSRIGALLLACTAFAFAHGDEHLDTGADKGSSHHKPATVFASNLTRHYTLYDEPSYASLKAHSGLMMAHIGFMVLAWFFFLPIGVMFSIARSKLALPVQLLVLLLNGFGVVAGTIYNLNTPNLYVNNAHHSIGWIATCVLTIHVIMSLLFVYSGRRKRAPTSTSSERAAFLPPSLQTLNGQFHRFRWSADTFGCEAESAASMSSSRTLSPSRDYEYTKAEVEGPEEMVDVQVETTSSTSTSFFKNNRIDRYLSKHVPQMTSLKFVEIAEVAYEIIDRTSLILSFITLATGIVTYTGIFRANNIFNGLAHWVKGGIFFWYGLLTLGRWLGSFADCGWAWNLKPTRSEAGWKARVPTAEFMESFVIFLYGSTNVFLEHLAAWGGKWTAQDFEHVSISIMFFGGGLAGMLVESKRLRTFLNVSVESMSSYREVHHEQAPETRKPPQSYAASLNIMPALVIFLLGIMMSSHHQESMISTMVHKQWGMLLSGFAVFRGLTYVLNYLSPPTSVYPSRPPTELAASFCLISGGLIFMLSTKDIIHYMEVSNLMAMFVFTVVMGFTAFLMAYTMMVVGLKGFAIRHEQKRTCTKGRC